MNTHMTSHRLFWVVIMFTALLATCARCIQSAPTTHVGPEADPFGPRCGPDDGVDPGRHGGGAAEVCRACGTVPPLLSSPVTNRADSNSDPGPFGWNPPVFVNPFERSMPC